MIVPVDFIYTITPLDIDMSYEHAAGVAAERSGSWARRNYSSLSKQQLDTFRGKLAECACWHLLRRTYPNATPPDFKVYARGEMKGHDADLRVGEKRYGVKSVYADSKFGWSWTFEKSDPKEDDIYMFAVVDERPKKNWVKVFWTLSRKDILNNLAPMIKDTCSTKHAVYHKDLCAHCKIPDISPPPTWRKRK